MNCKKILTLCSIFLFSISTTIFAQNEFRGLWVECQGSNDTLSSKTKITAMIESASKSNFNAIIVQVYRANKCWFNSAIGDASPYEEFKKKEGADLLDYLITEAHKRNLQVHAWLNIFQITKNTNAPMLKKLGNEILLRDNKGRSFLDYDDFKLAGEEGRWMTLSDESIVLDPANDKVHEYQLSIIKELIDKYPKLDGIHLDFIRYPYVVPYSPGSRFAKTLQFGYTQAAIGKFKKQTGLDPRTMSLDTKNTQAWDDFRREQVTRFVRSAFSLCKKKNSNLKVSAAVLCWADRAYLSAFQDWRGWLEDEIVDFIISMNYTKDRRFARYLSRTAARATDKSNGYVGIQAYMPPVVSSEVIAQLEDARKTGAKGLVIFSYDSVLKFAPSLFNDLSKGIFKDK